MRIGRRTAVLVALLGFSLPTASLSASPGFECPPVPVSQAPTGTLVADAERQQVSARALARKILESPNQTAPADLLRTAPELVGLPLELELCGLSLAQRARGELDKARLGFQTMQNVAGQIGHLPGEWWALRNLGVLAGKQGKSSEAGQYFSRSLEIARRMDDQQLIGRSLNNIATTLMDQGNYRESLDAYTRSEAVARALSDRYLLSTVLNNLGELNRLQGNDERAINYFQQSLQIDEADHRGPFQVAQTLNGVGTLYEGEGNHVRALEYYRRSLEMLTRENDVGLTKTVLNNLAAIYKSQGDYAAALDYSRRSLAISRKIDARQGTASALYNIAGVQQLQGQLASALASYRESLRIWEEIEQQEEVVRVLQAIGELYAQQKHYTQASAMHHRALMLAESLGLQASVAGISTDLAADSLRQNRYDEALRFARRATDYAARERRLTILRESRRLEGLALRGLGRFPEAREALVAAIGATEELRNQVAGGEESQQDFFATAGIAAYHDLLDLLLSQGLRIDALAVAEQARSRTLLDVLTGGRVNITKAMTPTERQQEEQIQHEIVSLNRRISKEKGKTAADTTALAELRMRLDRARTALRELQTTLYAAHPELQAQRGQVQPFTSMQAAELLPDSSTAVLEYVVAAEQTYLFVIRQGRDGQVQIDVHRIRISSDELERRAQQLRTQLARRDLAFRATAAELFALLVGPARHGLAGTTSLVVSPDGPLWNLPFQALISDAGRYVVEDYAVGYAPSLTVLREMTRLRAKRRDNPISPRQSTLLAMADPLLEGSSSDMHHVSQVYRGEQFQPLPDARFEVQALQGLYGREHTEIYIGAAAREDTFKSRAGEFRILHLATHALLDDANPMYSNILLAAGEEGSQDGLLEAREIMNLDLGADLVVLSACETARGRISAGEGVIGLSWSFFVAGIPTAVVSLWKVESNSTASLMLAFHRAMRGEAKPGSAAFATAKALRDAQLQLLRGKQYSHPFYWAGFVLAGDPD